VKNTSVKHDLKVVGIRELCMDICKRFNSFKIAIRLGIPKHIFPFWEDGFDVVVALSQLCGIHFCNVGIVLSKSYTIIENNNNPLSSSIRRMSPTTSGSRIPNHFPSHGGMCCLHREGTQCMQQ
jgi:hypothetical protein